MRRVGILWLGWVLLLPLAAAGGCGEDKPAAMSPGGTGGRASGGAGGSGNGGSGGVSTGGASGSGGVGAGGAAGGMSGAGGTSGAGGAAGGGAGGSPGDTGNGAPDSSASGPTLEQCFSGLRALATRSQLAHKRSADGAYEVRLALESPPDAVGTSGTVPWRAVRVGIVTPKKRFCVEETALAGAYKGSHHNCSDVLTVSAEGLNFQLKPPDTDAKRAATVLTITGEAAVPAVTLQTVTCTRQSGSACSSGGPCQ